MFYIIEIYKILLSQKDREITGAVSCGYHIPRYISNRCERLPFRIFRKKCSENCSAAASQLIVTIGQSRRVRGRSHKEPHAQSAYAFANSPQRQFKSGNLNDSDFSVFWDLKDAGLILNSEITPNTRKFNK